MKAKRSHWRTVMDIPKEPFSSLREKSIFVFERKHYAQRRSIIQLIRTASVRQSCGTGVIKELDINHIKGTVAAKSTCGIFTPQVTHDVRAGKCLAKNFVWLCETTLLFALCFPRGTRFPLNFPRTVMEIYSGSSRSCLRGKKNLISLEEII